MSVSLYPWPTLTTDKIIQIPIDVITTLVNPNPDLKEMYEIQVLKYGQPNDQDAVSDEQPNATFTD